MLPSLCRVAYKKSVFGYLEKRYISLRYYYYHYYYYKKLYSLFPVCFVSVCDLRYQRVIGVGVTQQRADGQQDWKTLHVKKKRGGVSRKV